jgi:YgiT-type zinc finger domain-containing protein
MKVVKVCPTCGSKKIKQITRDWKGRSHGKDYIVHSLTFYACPNCGEEVYDPEAVHKIQEESPSFSRRKRLAA